MRILLLTKNVEILLNSRNIKRFESLGYLIPREKDDRGRNRVKTGTKILIRTSDLSLGSHCKVEVRCDYCGKVSILSYKDYINRHDNELGDCCHKCENIKYKKTMLEKYGVENSFQSEVFIEKAKATNRQKYGADWGFYNTEIRNKIQNTMQEKYGTKYPLQVDAFLEKALITRSATGSTISKPQRKLYELLKEYYTNTQLEVPCDRCSLDCVVSIDNIKIDVEYDGWYWHQDKQRDRRRDNFVKSKGYKILRILGNKKDELPNINILIEHINKLVDGYNYTEITM